MDFGCHCFEQNDNMYAGAGVSQAVPLTAPFFCVHFGCHYFEHNDNKYACARASLGMQLTAPLFVCILGFIVLS